MYFFNLLLPSKKNILYLELVQWKTVAVEIVQILKCKQTGHIFYQQYNIHEIIYFIIICFELSVFIVNFALIAYFIKLFVDFITCLKLNYKNVTYITYATVCVVSTDNIPNVRCKMTYIYIYILYSCTHTYTHTHS